MNACVCGDVLALFCFFICYHRFQQPVHTCVRSYIIKCSMFRKIREEENPNDASIELHWLHIPHVLTDIAHWINICIIGDDIQTIHIFFIESRVGDVKCNNFISV